MVELLIIFLLGSRVDRFIGRFVVPAGHQALPAPRGPALPGQHLPGGRRQDVVPVGGAERVHRLRLELRTLPRHRLRPAQPAGAAG